MVRAGQQITAEEPELLKKKKPAEIDRKFAEMLNKAFSLPRFPESELLRYEEIAKKEQKPGWRAFLKEVLEAPRPESMTIDDYLKAAVSPRPVLVAKKPENAMRIKEMIATKVREMPGLKESAVVDAIRLAVLLESRKVNFRDWCGEEAVA